MHVQPSKSERRAGFVAAALTLILAIAAAFPAGAGASRSQMSMIQDATAMLSNPVASLQRVRELGINSIRLAIHWQYIAPNTNSFKRPRKFNATNPAAYPASAWAPFDSVIRQAQTDGIVVNLDVLGGAPLWATGPKMPHTSNCPCHNWAPSGSDFGAFMRAVGTRYSGNFNPIKKRLDPGNPADLPRVKFWSIWNEPDYGPSLAPQALPGTRTVEEAPVLYRGLVDGAWSALRATGHGSDTIVWGELAPRGTATFGFFDGMTPLVFLRAMYCVDKNYRPLRGKAASLRGCPTTAAGSAKFVSQHPALFKATGVSVHPYMRWYPPNQELNWPKTPGWSSLVKNYTTLATIGNLERALDRLVGVYHQSKRFPIWNTEFGYITSPPKRRWKKDKYPWVSPSTAAFYDNWAEYLSWKDPRLMSFEHYLIQDTVPALQSNDYGGFASGLLTFGGAEKPGYAAWRMPVFLPKTSAAAGQSLEVWGAARPSYFSQLDVADPGTVTIMFAPSGSSTFSPIATVPITDPHGYFDTRVAFPQSGTVALSWTYPADPLLSAGRTVSSRLVRVTIKP